MFGSANDGGGGRFSFTPGSSVTPTPELSKPARPCTRHKQKQTTWERQPAGSTAKPTLLSCEEAPEADATESGCQVHLLPFLLCRAASIKTTTVLQLCSVRYVSRFTYIARIALKVLIR